MEHIYNYDEISGKLLFSYIKVPFNSVKEKTLQPYKDRGYVWIKSSD